MSRKMSELTRKAMNSQTVPTVSRPLSEKAPSDPVLPISRPADRLASTPDRWKCSASRNEP